MLTLKRPAQSFLRIFNLTYLNRQDCRTKRYETPSQALFPARSWLFTAKTRESFVKATQSKADIIVLDLEDSVPKDMKTKVLQEYISGLDDGIFQGKKVFVRLCDLEDYSEVVKQVDVLTRPDVSGFILPMVQGPVCVHEYDQLVKHAEEKRNILPGIMKFVILIETLGSYYNVEKIAKACERNAAIISGCADFEVEAHCKPKSSTNETFLSQVVLAAKAANILPIAGVWNKIDDHVGTEKFYRRMKACGFSGTCAVTISQSIQANIAFSYSPSELQWAEDVLQLETGISMVQPSVQESREMIGPPHKKTAARIYQEDKSIRNMLSSAVENKPSTFPIRMRQRGLKDSVQIGSTLRPSLEITITDSWKVLWESAFLTFNRLSTSNEFAARLGLKSTPLPFTMINTLAAAMSVTSFSESARVHLGFYDAVQLQPVFPGDTLRAVCHIDNANKSIKGGVNQYTVVYSTHRLVNQSNDDVFTVKKRTMFPPLKIENHRQDNDILNNTSLVSWKQVITSLSKTVLTSAHRPQPVLAEGEVIIHNDDKCFGISETRMLCKLFKITNAHHHNVIRYSSSDLLVPGPFVIAAMTSNAEYDLGDLIYEQYPIQTNINKVNPGDQIGTLTYVQSIRQLAENSDLEEITLKHIGTKNVDLEWLINSGVPGNLFSGELQKPAHYEELCAEECPILYRKIACQATRKIIRIKPEVCAKQ